MTDLGPDRVADLLADALSATGAGVGVKAKEAMHTLFVDGTRTDCLAFVGGCLALIQEILPAGVRAELALARVDEDGSYELVDGDPGEFLPSAVHLAALCLTDFLDGKRTDAWDRWLGAEDAVAAACVGVLLRQASELVRSANARLN